MKLNATPLSAMTYFNAMKDLRGLLGKIGRQEFRAYGYSHQLRSYRAAYRSKLEA